MQQFLSSENNLNYQHLRNKTTVKKDKNISERLIRFNQMTDKENQYNQNNIMYKFDKFFRAQQIKTISRKSNQIQQQNMQCANHPEKQAQFIVRIDGEILNYCRKCATHIASQGFEVQKISQNRKRNNPHSRGNSLLQNISPTRNRQIQNGQMQKRNQLNEFMKKLKSLKTQYNKKHEHLNNICGSFQNQKQTLTNYYASLIQYIEDMRDTHLQAIEEASVNNTQICEIQAGQVQETMGEIDEMMYDIQSNMESIINEIDQENYAECFSFYRQKEGIFSHRLEQLGSEAKPWPCTSQSQISDKFQNFKDFLDQLHGIQS